MVNIKQQNVFIYCNTGISRAPTIIMAYLCLYKIVKDWNDIDIVSNLIKLHLKGTQPNRIAIKNVIMKNKLFQDRQSFDNVTRLRSTGSISDIN